MEPQIFRLFHDNEEDIRKKAKELVKLEASNIQTGLKTRWAKVNISMGKWFRFGNNILIAGMSRSGKSTFVNQIIQDFTDIFDPVYIDNLNSEINSEPINVFKGLNKNYNRPVIVIYFSFEMTSVNEILRMVSSQLNVSYSYLLSSSIKDNKYLKLTKKEIDIIEELIDLNLKRKVFYFCNPGTINQLYNTVYEVKNKNPNSDIVTILDHTLFLKRSSEEKNELELITNLATKQVRIKKDFNSLNIAIGQLNSNIEEKQRKEKPNLHYPIKDDIHGSNQLFNAMDDVFIYHKPQLLNLLEYTPEKLNTNGLVHLLKLKGRFTGEGSIWFHVDYSKNTIINVEKTFFMKEDKKKFIPND